MATTLYDIPMSFLKKYSHILKIYKKGEYRDFGGEYDFPNDLTITIGQFLESPACFGCDKLLERINGKNKDFSYKDLIIDLYDIVNSEIPFGLVREYCRVIKGRPSIYDNNLNDNRKLSEIFSSCDDTTRHIMSIDLVTNTRFKQCERLQQSLRDIKDEDNILTQLKTFIRCYIDYYNGYDSERTRILEFKYKDCNQKFNMGSLATEVQLSENTIRTKLKKSIQECQVFLLKNMNSTIGGFLSDSFKDRINELKDKLNKQMIYKKEFVHNLISDEIDKRTLDFVCDLFELNELEYEDELFFVKNDLSILKIKNLLKTIDDHFTEYPIGVRMESLLSVVNEEYRDFAIQYIKISNHFHEPKCVNGEDIYMIKWQYLKQIGPRIARILYEENSELTKQNILDIYNKKAKIYNIKRIDEINCGRYDLIESVGRTGVWKLRNTQLAISNNGVSSAEDLIRNFINQLDSDKEIVFDELKQYVNGKGGATYPDRTLKATLNTLGYQSKGRVYVLAQSTRFSLDSLIEEIAKVLLSAENKTMGQTELIKTINLNNRDRNVNVGTFYRAIGKASDLFIQSKDGKSKQISLIPDSIDNIDFTQYIEEKESPEYHNAIYQTAIDELRRSTGFSLPLNELKRRVEMYVPEGNHKNVIYKIFDKYDIFIKSSTSPKTISLNLERYKEFYTDKAEPLYCKDVNLESGITKDAIEFGFNWENLKQLAISNLDVEFDNPNSKNEILDKMYNIMCGNLSELSSNNQFWKALDLLNRLYLYPTSPYERELLSTKLILGVENYISNLLGIDNNPDENGLYLKIIKAQDEGFLPNRYAKHKINKLVGRIITNRNRYSHTNNEGQHGFNDILKNINLCLKFYIYVAEYNAQN